MYTNIIPSSLQSSKQINYHQYKPSKNEEKKNQEEHWMSESNKKWPDLPWRVKLLVSAMSFGVDITRRSEGAINRSLMNFLDLKNPPSPNKPVNGVTTNHVTVDAARNLWFRLYTPATAGGQDPSLPVLFYFHGGGFAYMSADSKPYDDICCRLARGLHAVVLSVNYRLSPEHRCPCQYEDGFDVLKFMDNHDTETIQGFPSRANLKHCFLAGDSAGGNLAHNVAVKASEHQFSKLKLIGIVSIQPFFGGEERTESEIRLQGAPFITTDRTDWMWKAFLPDGSNRDHPACNVFGPNSVDISGLRFPVTIVFVGGFDPLIDWGKRYFQGLKKAGKEAYLVEYPNAIHTFYAYPELPECSNFFREVKDFMGKQIVASNDV